MLGDFETCILEGVERSLMTAMRRRKQYVITYEIRDCEHDFVTFARSESDAIGRFYAEAHKAGCNIEKMKWFAKEATITEIVCIGYVDDSGRKMWCPDEDEQRFNELCNNNFVPPFPLWKIKQCVETCIHDQIINFGESKEND